MGTGRPKVDRLGRTYGWLTVIEDAGVDRNGYARWLCRCTCGTEIVTRGSSLQQGQTRSCGCLKKDPSVSRKGKIFKDRTGLQFGRLTVLRPAGQRSGSSDNWWLCRCDCGAEVEVRGGSLQSGQTKSCGNHKAETAHRTHGLAHTREWRIWSGMKGRCLNPNDDRYLDYGGRGITICDEWVASFERFYADMGPAPTPQHSIDRVDVDGPYSAANARWATPEEQATNKRPRIKNSDARITRGRVSELEAALAALDPNHPLLSGAQAT